MKRPVLLSALLALLLLIWGGLRLQDRQWRRWLATASREELTAYVAAHPDQHDALLRLGVLQRHAGENAEAEKRLRHAVEVAPDDETGWVEFSRALTDDHEAIRVLEEALKTKESSAPMMAELARHYLQSGDVVDARTWAEKATQQQPASPDAWRIRGDVMAATHQAPEAEKDYRKALALRDDPETRLALARTLIPLQRYAEILALCAPIVRAGDSPEISQEQRARALLYTAGGRLYDPLTPAEIAALQAQLQEADSLSAQLTPNERFLPPYFLGESYLRLGKPKEAIPLLERSATMAPMFAGSLYSLARAYRLAGEQAKADATVRRHTRLSRILGEIEMYNNRLEQKPGDAETMLRLADVLTEADDTADAAQIYRHLIAQGKLVARAQHKLQALPAPH